jgi:DNA-binding transcriptional ArsR family regulator
MSSLNSGDQSGRHDQYDQSDPGDQHDHDVDRILERSRGDRADRGARWHRGSGPYVDTQLFSELDTGVYEAVATLEYLGSAATVDQIREATGLDAPAVGEILDALTEHGVLTRRRTDAGDAFELARRDWSATPEIRSH